MSMSQAGQILIWLVLLLIEMRFEIDFPAVLLGDNQSSIAVAYSPSSTRYARHIDLCGQSLWRACSMPKVRDYTRAYIRTHSNMHHRAASGFPKTADPVSFRGLRDWMANGLDGQWGGEVVETLENLFQQYKMREMFISKRNLALFLAQTKQATQDGLRPRKLRQPGPYFATAIQDEESEDYCDPSGQRRLARRHRIRSGPRTQMALPRRG
jgi:hypothetical protein